MVSVFIVSNMEGAKMDDEHESNNFQAISTIKCASIQWLERYDTEKWKFVINSER